MVVKIHASSRLKANVEEAIANHIKELLEELETADAAKKKKIKKQIDDFKKQLN